MKKAAKIIFIILGALLVYGSILFFKLSDLRPDNYNYPNNPAKAKVLLVQMGQAHGIQFWDSIQTYTVSFEDEFYGFFGKQAHPFKEQKMEFSLQYIPNTFDGQLKIVSGIDSGIVWGIQSGETYTFNSENRNVVMSNNEDMVFWIPTYQYFIEFPKRIQEATALDYIGEKTIDGIQVEGVLASWNSVDPQKDTDQYVVWIAKETKRIVKIEYTVRDAYNFVLGAAAFKDYKTFNGIVLPSIYPVESNLVKDGLLHEMRIKDFKINNVSRESLRPLD